MASSSRICAARRTAALGLLALLAMLTRPLYAENREFTGVKIILNELVQTYDGTPKPVTVTTIPAGLPVRVTYDGSTDAPADAGSYTVIATIELPLIQVSAKDT